jgi:molybdopterin synthase sulfur carrier subunit
MVKVQLTSNLQKYYPKSHFEIEANSILDLLKKMDQVREKFSSYILEDDNSVRKHVNIFVNNELIPKTDTGRKLQSGNTVHIMQALSGG